MSFYVFFVPERFFLSFRGHPIGSDQEREWREREEGLPHQPAEQPQARGRHAV